jgi:hypothetical protein
MTSRGLASIAFVPYPLRGQGGAEALNTDDGDSRDKIVGGKGCDCCYLDPGDAVSGCNVPYANGKRQ